MLAEKKKHDFNLWAKAVEIIQKNKEDTYKELIKFYDIIEKVINILDEIKNNKFGKLILSSSRCVINWDGFIYLLIPIIYFNNINSLNINNNKLIKLITIWYYRNLGTKTYTFANLKYSNEFIKYTNKYIEDNTYDYYKDIVKLFNKNCENKDNYVINNIKLLWKGGTHKTQIKYLLLMYETLTTSDANILEIDKIDLEHILPLSTKESDLKNPNNIHKLGNFTLFESKNSENNHKGNRSIKNNDYNIKKEQYKESAFKITRDLSNKYKLFTENDIEKRSNNILLELNDLLKF